jgi:pimeloyl-ACP methyl ester carboxylesterase
MGEANVEEFGAALRGQEALRAFLEREAAGLTGSGAAGLKEGLATLLAPVDAATLATGIADFLYESMVAGLRPGVDGWLDDDLAFVGDWGFDPASIERPVLLLHGAHDRFVPAAHFHRLARRIPSAEASLEPGHGHLSLAEHLIGRVHDWLLEDRSVGRRS